MAEITGMEGDIITMQDIFTFNRTGIGPNGEVLGYFSPTGVRPRFSERLAAAGIRFPMDMFQKSKPN